MESFDINLTIETFWQFIYKIEKTLLQQRCFIHDNKDHHFIKGYNKPKKRNKHNINCKQQYFIHKRVINYLKTQIICFANFFLNVLHFYSFLHLFYKLLNKIRISIICNPKANLFSILDESQTICLCL